MKEEILIKKWLDNELSAEELLEFQQLEGFESFVKLSERAKLFQSPSYDSKKAYKNLLPVIERRRERKSKLKRLIPFIQVAALLVVGVVVYSMLFVNASVVVDTLAMQKSSIVLPDNSKVELNAMSSLSYDEKKWKKNREVILMGEAFFKVEKGAKFDVNTYSGIVSVVGTQFNVKVRDDYFEVKCFEGKVNVLYKGNQIPLPAGKSIRVINENIYHAETKLEEPSWVAEISSFESIPLYEVIAEFERQYNITVIFDSKTDTSVLYSGKFVHNNRDLAIQSIAVPFGLGYTIINNKVTLKKLE